METEPFQQRREQIELSVHVADRANGHARREFGGRRLPFGGENFNADTAHRSVS